MVPRPPEFVVDERGKKTKVILKIEDYEKLLEELEELDDIRAYDEAKAAGETPVPFRPRRVRTRRAKK